MLIALIELLEAEARAARKAFTKFWSALLLISVIVALLVVVVGLLLWAVYLQVITFATPPLAASAAAGVALIGAAILLWIVQRLIR